MAGGRHHYGRNRAGGFAITEPNAGSDVMSIETEAGDGAKIVFSSLANTRLSAAAGAVDCAQACYEIALKYCNERVQFGQQIGKFQMNQELLPRHSHLCPGGRLRQRLQADHRHGPPGVPEGEPLTYLPENPGSRFSAMASNASRWSSVVWQSAWSAAAWSRCRARLSDCAEQSSRLAMRSASGGYRAILPAISMVFSMSDSWGTT